MQTPNTEFNPIKTAQILLGVDAIVWTGLGLFSFVVQAGKYPDQSALYHLVALIMFANAAAMLLSARLLGKRKKVFYVFTLAVLLVNILFTFTDQVGMLDLMTFFLDLAIFIILILKRDDFFRGPDLM
jgi:lysylphosphatidylglycerol synthetase-like protein (DUF2156 family)